MSRVRGRLERLERSEAELDSRRGGHLNMFDQVLQILLGNMQLADVRPADRDFVAQLCDACAVEGDHWIPGQPVPVSPQSSQEAEH